MREAVGSTILFKLMIFFIFFFASFLAIAINYSQAFRIKNSIINILEQQEGYTSSSRDKIVETINDYKYYRQVSCPDGSKVLNSSNQEIKGLCITKLPDASNTTNRYYKVTTYVSFNLPIIGNILNFKVNGETKIITNVNPATEL